MITIPDNALPIDVASELIHAKKEEKLTTFQRTLMKAMTGEDPGETNDVDVFSDDDLRKIAYHLLAHTGDMPPKFPALPKNEEETDDD